MKPYPVSINYEIELTEAQYNLFFYSSEFDQNQIPDFIENLDGVECRSTGEYHMSFTLESESFLDQAVTFFQGVIDRSIEAEIAKLEGLRGKR